MITQHHNTTTSRIGAIIGRDDLSDIDIHRAIGRRLVAMRIDRAVDKVIADALAGNAEVIEMIRTIDVPAPTSRLSMPVQELKSGVLRQAFGLAFGQAATSRG